MIDLILQPYRYMISILLQRLTVSDYKEEITVTKDGSTLIIEAPTKKTDGSITTTTSLEHISETITLRKQDERRDPFNKPTFIPTDYDLTERIPPRTCRVCGSTSTSYELSGQYNSYVYHINNPLYLCDECLQEIEKEIEKYLSEHPEHFIGYHI